MADAPTNWIDFYISLSPVAETAIWASVAIAGFATFRKSLNRLAEVLINRVVQGDSLKTPWLSVERAAEREREVVQAVTKNIEMELSTSGSISDNIDKYFEASKIEGALKLVREKFILVVFPNSLIFQMCTIPI